MSTEDNLNYIYVTQPESEQIYILEALNWNSNNILYLEFV